MEKLNKAISSKERLNDIKALKQRFKILKPEALPEWINIEAFALAESHLGTWVQISTYDRQIEWRLGVPESEEEAFRISKLVLGTNNLFKSLDMQYSWEKVKNIFVGDPVRGQAWFSMCLTQSFAHPRSNFKTRGEAKAQKKALLSTLEKALKLAHELPTNLAVEWRNELVAIEENQGDPDAMDRSDQEKSLFNLIGALKSSEVKQGELPKSIHGKNSERLVFIRSLTSSFLRQTGRPYRKVVADAASAAFDCNLSETEIIRATKNIELQPSNAMSSYLEEDTLENLKISDLLKDPFS